jgi:hypothetical protein
MLGRVPRRIYRACLNFLSQGDYNAACAALQMESIPGDSGPHYNSLSSSDNC